MRSAFPKIPRARRPVLTALSLFILCASFWTACSLDGASKKERAAAGDGTPKGAGAPPTSLPMPPVESAHRTDERGASGWTLLDGRRASLADHRGEVVVLDFYATYCPPCRDEIPHLVRLQRRYGPQGFKVVGLNVGGAEDQAKVPDYVGELGIQYQLANPDDTTVELFLAGNSAIPQTFVFDRQGRVVKHFVGYDEQVAQQLEAAVQTALKEKTGD
ncbi:MAG: TlpA family protein disulfide reductase [Acidobacteria bacterium]|nr:TlpA family protein disulfide reductase [Acidobacteriota bacterium]